MSGPDPATVPAPDPARADAAVRSAQRLQDAGRFDEAVVAWRAALALRGDAFELWSALGACAMRARQVAEGVAAFARAAGLRPDLAGTWFNLGNARAAAGDPGAIAAFEEALRRDPAYAPAALNLADRLLEAGRAADALATIERAQAAAPAAAGLDRARGLALLALGRAEDAAAACRAAVVRDPADHDARNDLCLALMRAGRAAEALAACDAWLAAAPAHRKALAYRAAALIELGRRGEAAALLDFERLVMRRPLAAPSGFGTVAAFNDALAAAVLAHPTLEFEPAGKATRGGHQSGELFVPAPGSGEVAPALAALKAAIVAAVTAYARGLRSALPDHPYAAHLPARWRLASWAVVLAAQGHQGPHFHPDGFVSGVYYLRLPAEVKADAGDAGAIEFGRTAAHFGGRAEPLTATLRPAEGLMLLFPSYMYHRTLPFESSEPRICIAFDALPG